MKRILLTMVTVMLVSAGLFAASEQAWYNDVTTIANNGQYYIYSVNGAGFMEGGNSKLKSVNSSNHTSTSTLLFTISNPSNGKTYNGSNYLSSYQAGTNGPVDNSNGKGTTISWTNQGSYWNIYASYNFIWAQTCYLYYNNN